jgi:hypothetical protein
MRAPRPHNLLCPARGGKCRIDRRPWRGSAYRPRPCARGAPDRARSDRVADGVFGREPLRIDNGTGRAQLNDEALHHPTAAGSRTATEPGEGQELLAWCHARHSSLDQRLRLFIQLCRLVGAGHRRAQLHGGIEPGRVLVGGAGRIELLAPRGGVPAPACAAPEQLAGGELSRATDVYALGVLLYRLLSARTPIAIAGLPAALAIERAIRETPSPPSAAATPDAPVAPRRLRGDLDAIVLKCLRKDPRERYAGAPELEAELQRFLAHRPVRVRGAARAYLVRRFLRRHRLAMTAASLLLTAAAYTAAAMVHH